MLTDSYHSAAVNRESLVKRRTRPNPAVARSEAAAQAAEEMARLASQSLPESNLAQRIARRKRATADRIRKERPNLIELGE